MIFPQDWQHIVVDPIFNLFGVRKFTGKRRRTQTALVNDDDFFRFKLGGDLLPSFISCIDVTFQRVHGILFLDKVTIQADCVY